MKHILRMAVVVLALAGWAAAQATIPQVKVAFDKGSTSKTVQGTVQGRDGVDYVVRAAAGQTMSVTLVSKSTSLNFNVIPPGEENVAIFIGSTSGTKYEGTLPATGDYKIRLYLMGAAARKAKAVSFSLQISVAGAAK